MSEKLSSDSQGQKYPEKVHVDVECKTFDLTSLDSDGKLVPTIDGPSGTGFLQPAFSMRPDVRQRQHRQEDDRPAADRLRVFGKNRYASVDEFDVHPIHEQCPHCNTSAPTRAYGFLPIFSNFSLTTWKPTS